MNSVKEKEKTESIEKEKIKDNKLNFRDSSIDLIRIIACMIVILTHLALQIYNVFDIQVDWSRLFEKSFFNDGVPLFFMITGFFLVNGRSYKKIVKSTLFKIVFPSFLYIVFSQYFYKFIINEESLKYCFKENFFNWLAILSVYLKADVTYVNSTCAHLWYIFSYIKIVLWIPILWLLFKDNKECNFARQLIIAFGIISCIAVDIQRFNILDCGIINIFNYVPREILYVILGYELFRYKDKIKGNKKIAIIGLIIFTIINIIRYKLEAYYMVINNYYEITNRDNFMEWNYTSLTIFSSIGLFVFLYSFKIENLKFKKILLFVSDKTFGIYLIHYLLLAKVDLFKFEKFGLFYQEIIYLFLGLIVTFIISLIIVTLIKYIISKIKILIIKIKEIKFLSSKV